MRTDAMAVQCLANSPLLSQLRDVRAFIMYRLVHQVDGSLGKVPVSPYSSRNCDPHNPNEWMLPAEAVIWAEQYGEGYGVGVVISEQIVLPGGLRMFCLDLDKCRDGDVWLPHAGSFCARFPGSYIECSVSGNGLHIIACYRGDRPDHGVKNRNYRMELYSRLRFIAVTGYGAIGSVLVDHTQAFRLIASEFFPPHDTMEYTDALTDAPVSEWSGPDDDDELLRRALASKSPQSVFRDKATFADLWHANETVLARAFPPFKSTAYDESAADLALANHLAFWTGSHGERMERLMRRSNLRRSKWDRPGYLIGTINRACGSQRQWYKGPRGSVAALTVSVSANTSTALSEKQAALDAPASLSERAHVMTLNRKNQFEATIENLVHVLGEQQQIAIGCDEFCGRIMISSIGGQDWRPLTDIYMIQLREALAREQRFAPIGKELMRDALQLVAERHSFDSAITWLNGLEWDGVPRVARFLITHCGAADNDYTRAVSSYIWTGLAGRVLDPGCQLDMVVAVQSPQGRRKSTGLQAIAPAEEYFTDSISLNEDDSDFSRLLRGKLVVEIAELAGLRRADINVVKRTITRRIEEWIEKWQTLETRYKRRCMLFATTNDERFLPPDETGNRRWLPVEIEQFDRERIITDREQLWAEGAYIYRQSGIAWADAERLAAERHHRYEQTDIWETEIERWLNAPTLLPSGAPSSEAPCKRPFALSEVLAGALCLTPAAMDAKSEKRAARVLRQLGYEPRDIKIDGKARKRWVRVV